MHQYDSLLSDIGNEFLAIVMYRNRLRDKSLKEITRETIINLIDEKKIFVTKLIALACKQDRTMSQSIYLALYNNNTFKRGRDAIHTRPQNS